MRGDFWYRSLSADVFLFCALVLGDRGPRTDMHMEKKASNYSLLYDYCRKTGNGERQVQLEFLLAIGHEDFVS